MSRLGSWIKARLGWLDRHAVAVLLLVWAALTVALWIIDGAVRGPVLIAGAEADHRVEIFSQLAQSGITVGAAALTVLGILTALPDSERVVVLRARRSWRLLEQTLLIGGLLGLLTTVLSHICTGVDNGPRGREPLEAVLLASAAVCALAVLIGGVAFTMVLAQLRAPQGRQDPKGRGYGPS